MHEINAKAIHVTDVVLPAHQLGDEVPPGHGDLHDRPRQQYAEPGGPLSPDTRGSPRRQLQANIDLNQGH